MIHCPICGRGPAYTPRFRLDPTWAWCSCERTWASFKDGMIDGLVIRVLPGVPYPVILVSMDGAPRLRYGSNVDVPMDWMDVHRLLDVAEVLES